MNSIDIIVAAFERQQLPILTIQDVTIGPQEATGIAEAIQRNRMLLTILNIKHCHFQSENELGEILRAVRYSQIMSLSFEGSFQAFSKEPKVLAAFLRETKTLLSLDLSDCHIQFALGGIMDAIEVNNSIQLLNLKGNQIQRAAPIVFALQENSTLKVLHLENNHLSRREIGAILRLIEQPGTLRSIFLQNNNGLMPLGVFDKHTPYHFDLKLEHLGISLRRSNRSLASFLTKTISLNSLSVTCHYAREFLSIAKALGENTSITHLELFFRAHSTENFGKLLATLCKYESFVKISLTFDFTLAPLSSADLEEMITLIQENSDVRYLKIIHPRLLDEHATKLASVLAVNKPLKQLHLVVPKMAMSCHQAFASALRQNAGLIVFTNTAVHVGCYKIYSDSITSTNLLNITFSQGAEGQFYPPEFGLRNLVATNQARLLQEISELVDNLTSDTMQETARIVETCLDELSTCSTLLLLHVHIAKNFSNQLAVYYLNRDDLTQASALYASPYIDSKQLSIDIASWIANRLQPNSDHSKTNPVLQYYFTTERRPHLYALNWKMALVLLHPYFADDEIQRRLQDVAMNLCLQLTKKRAGELIYPSLSQEKIKIVSKEFIRALILEIAEFDLVNRKLISDYFLQLKPAALHAIFQMPAIKSALQQKLGTSNVIVADHLLTHPLDFPIKEALVVCHSVDDVTRLLHPAKQMIDVMAESKRNFLRQHEIYESEYEDEKKLREYEARLRLRCRL